MKKSILQVNLLLKQQTIVSSVILLHVSITSSKYNIILDAIRPICLPLMGDSELINNDGQSLMLAGWGFTDQERSKFFDFL